MYDSVQKALEEGADPTMLCATCPWDRFCIVPPSMTSAEVKAKLDEASAKDAEEYRRAKAEGKDGGLPLGSILTAVTLGQRDKQATVCPVFAIRLRSSDGEGIVHLLKDRMKELV